MRPFLLALVLSGCLAPRLVAVEERPALVRELTGQRRFLRATSAVIPPADLRVLFTLRTVTAPPGARVLPAGTPVRIVRVELPTAWGLVRDAQPLRAGARVWLELEDTGPCVLELSTRLASAQELERELSRTLALADPGPRLATFPEPVRRAIATQTTVPDMPQDALEYSWGAPDRRHLELSAERRTETWEWNEGGRKASLIDGRLAEATEN